MFDFRKCPAKIMALRIVYIRRYWRHCDDVIVPERTRSRFFVLFSCWALTLDRLVLAAPTKQRILVVNRGQTPYCCVLRSSSVLYGTHSTHLRFVSCEYDINCVFRVMFSYCAYNMCCHRLNGFV